MTASTREAARRLGVSDTAIHKAERSGRIAREPDGQWDIDKTRRRLTETADPVRLPLAMPAPQRLSTCGGAKPEGSTTAGAGGGAAGAVVAGMPPAPSRPAAAGRGGPPWRGASGGLQAWVPCMDPDRHVSAAACQPSRRS
jgi:hypothetical protein